MNDILSLSQTVRDFILQYIDSVAELEGLLLLRAETSHTWTTAKLAGRLYVDEHAAESTLTALHRAGLVSLADGGFRYRPASDAMRLAIDELATSYPRFLIPITNLIHSKPRSLRDFADAFRLREDT